MRFAALMTLMKDNIVGGQCQAYIGESLILGGFNTYFDISRAFMGLCTVVVQLYASFFGAALLV